MAGARHRSADGLSYEIHGTGPLCLTLHGGPGMSSGLWPALRPLARYARLVIYDHRGHGLSAGQVPRRNALVRLADDAARLARELSSAPIAVLGHSNGGFIALHLAIRHPDVVDRLVLVNTAASGRFKDLALREASLRARKTMLAALDRLWNDGLRDARAFRRAWKAVQPMYLHRPTPARVERIVAPLRFDVEARRRILPQYATFDVRPLVGGIRRPALVAVGRHDWITPPLFSEELVRLLPRASLLVFERSGHYPFLEERAAFALHVGRFLAAAQPHDAVGRTRSPR